MLKRMDTDGSGTLDKTELQEGLRNYYGISNVSPVDMSKLFS